MCRSRRFITLDRRCDPDRSWQATRRRSRWTRRRHWAKDGHEQTQAAGDVSPGRRPPFGGRSMTAPILERVADTKACLDRVATDLRAAALDLAADPPILDDLVFHCQQAVEKAMKAFLSWHDEPFGKTHNLETLGEACLRLDSTLRSLVD